MNFPFTGGYLMYKWVLLVINLSLFIGLIACGGPTTASEERFQAAKSSSVGIATEIEFITGEGTITGPNTSKSGWVRFTLKNDGSSIANMALVNLGSGNSVESLSSHVSQNKALPDWAYPSAGIADTATGSTANVTLMLDAGEYAIVRYGVSENGSSYPISDGILPFTVTQSDAVTEEPVATVIVKMQDIGVVIQPVKAAGKTLASPIKSGKHIIRITNEDDVVHELKFRDMDTGVSPDEDPMWIKQRGCFVDQIKLKDSVTSAGGGGQHVRLGPACDENDERMSPTEPPVNSTSVGGVMGLAPGKTAYVITELNSGYYYIYSALPNAENGEPDFLHEYIQEFIVSY